MKGEDVDQTDLFAAFEEDETDKNGEIPESNIQKNNVRIEEKELDSLRDENIQLKKILRRITCRTQDEKPIANIMYFDSEDSLCIDKMMKEFLKKPVNTRKCSEEITNNQSSFRDDIAAALRQNHMYNETETETNLPLGNIKYYSTYCLDSFGRAEVNQPDPPRFEKVYFKILPANEDSSNKRRPWNSCFNCDGDHKLPECPKPHDLARISTRRKEFFANSSFTHESRYHDKEKEQKFKHFKPGKVTPELRKALGLSEKELPPYIYRMRSLGYPPGWFSSIYNSGIVIHGKEGKTDRSASEKTGGANDKQIRFPGFNCHPTQGIEDLANFSTLPRINKYGLLPVEEDIKTPDRKHKLSKDECEQSSKRRRTSDMDIEDNNATGESLDAPYSPTSPNESMDTPYSPKLPPKMPCFTSTPARIESEVEDGEIPDSPGTQPSDQNEIAPSWWFKEPLVPDKVVKPDHELVPPPFPLRPLPLHKISQILPRETNHISFEDRSLWLDPVFGNLQIRTGRFDRLKTILATREKN